MKFNQTLSKIVDTCISTNNIPMLLGEPGIGKSSFLENVAIKRGTKCFTLACNQLADKADLTGARLVPHEIEVRQPDGSIKTETSYSQVFYPHKTITDAILYAKNNPREEPLLFLDELNRTTPDVTSELLSIPTMRAIGNAELPSNLRIVAAGNDKGNITSLDKASVSRFVFIHVEPDAQTFLGIHADLNPFIRNVLNMHPETIYGITTVLATDPKPKNNEDDDDDNAIIEEIAFDGDDMSQITTPRTIAGLSRYLNSLDKKEILAMIQETNKTAEGMDMSVLQETIEGFVGHTMFSALLIAEIVNNVMTVQTTTNASTIPKPPVYDQLKACQDMTAINTLIAGMTDKEKSGCLTYAVCEKQPNEIYIKALADSMTAFEQDDMKVLAYQGSTGGLDQDNAHALLDTNKPFIVGLSFILNM